MKGNVGLYCIQIVKKTPEMEKSETLREVYIVADSPEAALAQLDVLKNDCITFRNDEHKSQLVSFGPTEDPKVSKIYH